MHSACHPRTVKWYLSRIYGKLRVAGRDEAVARVRDLGLGTNNTAAKRAIALMNSPRALDSTRTGTAIERKETPVTPSPG